MICEILKKYQKKSSCGVVAVGAYVLAYFQIVFSDVILCLFLCDEGVQPKASGPSDLDAEPPFSELVVVVYEHSCF